MEFSDGIVASAIGGLTTIIMGVISYLQAVKLKKLDSEKKEIAKQLESKDEQVKHISALDYLLDFELFSHLKNIVDDVFNSTHASYFFMAIAVNGKTDFKKISIIYDQRKEPKKAVPGLRFETYEIDEHYKNVLKSIETNSVSSIVSDTLPSGSDIKFIFELEGVKHSYVKFLKRFKLNEDDDVIVYSSFTTSEPEDFNVNEKKILNNSYIQITNLLEAYMNV